MVRPRLCRRHGNAAGPALDSGAVDVYVMRMTDAGNEDDQQALFTLGELVEALDLTPRAIRFYEAKGLIQPKRIGERRVFDRRDRARLMLILRGKRLGFSLKEIAEYLRLYEAGSGQCEQLRLLLARVRERLARLERQRQDLELTIGELQEIERQAMAALAQP